MAFHPIAADDDDAGRVGVARKYAWIVFALTFGLLISDYMSRQVLNAVFPLLKSEWALERRSARPAQWHRRPDGRPADVSRCRCWPTASAGSRAWR